MGKFIKNFTGFTVCLSLMLMFSSFFSYSVAQAVGDETLFKPVFYATAGTGAAVGLTHLASQGLFFNDPIVSNLSTYAGRYAKGLIGQLFNNLESTEITWLQNIKGKTKFAKLTVGAGLKPYTPSEAFTDTIDYTDRALTPDWAKRELQIEPAKYRNTFLEDSVKPTSTYYNIPEENYVWMKVIEALKNEIILNTINLGDTASATPAKAVTDGFKKIIDAMGLTAIATGALTNANAVTKCELMYKTAMLSAPEWMDEDLNMYCSWTNYYNYIEHYRTAFPMDPSIYSDGAKPMYLRISNRRCKLTPVTWLNTSGRLILTPKANLVGGTDKLSDMNTINTIPALWTLKAGIRFSIGFQVIDPACIWINDQA